MDWLDSMVWGFHAWELLALACVGFGAGLAGGMLGIGGGVINIPAITLILGRGIHLAQAASMVVTLFVAVPAAIRHARAGALRKDALVRILPTALVGILIGVTASIWVSNDALMIVFGIFLVFVFLDNLHRLLGGRKTVGGDPADERVTWPRGGGTGLCVGSGAGLLGIGGGLITVPLVQLACRLNLRQSIATSATVMCCTAPVGTVWKLVTLHDVPDIGADVHWYGPLPISLCLIPTCLIGSWIGARLTHVLPVKVVRGAFMAVVGAGAIRMLT